MDALALLCNLHADGPVTLQRLRRSGLESLTALLELDAEELADRIGWEDRPAERFLREAWCLSERLEEGLLDEEDDEGTEWVELEGIALPAPRRADEPSSEDDDADADEDEETSDEPGDAADPDLVTAYDEDAFDEEDDEGLEDESEADDDDEARDEEPRFAPMERVRERVRGEAEAEAMDHAAAEAELDRVLGAWRDLDLREPPAPPPERVPAGQRSLLQPFAPGVARAPGVPGGSPASGLPLDRIAGLGAPLRASLEASGLATVEDVLRYDEMELARRLGLGYTRVARLSFLARRALARQRESAEATPAPRARADDPFAPVAPYGSPPVAAPRPSIEAFEPVRTLARPERGPAPDADSSAGPFA